MDGVGGTLNATHVGELCYEVLVDDGSVATLDGTAYYVPNLPVTLFSPQEYFRQKHEAGLHGYSMMLDWGSTKLNLGPNVTITIPHDDVTHLPKLRCFADAMKTAETMAMQCVTNEYNQNLTHLQKLLLQWHWKLGHFRMQ